jgi:hypothetical protein
MASHTLALGLAARWPLLLLPSAPPSLTGSPRDAPPLGLAPMLVLAEPPSLPLVPRGDRRPAAADVAAAAAIGRLGGRCC